MLLITYFIKKIQLIVLMLGLVMEFVMMKTISGIVFLMEVTVVLVQQKPICIALNVNVMVSS